MMGIVWYIFRDRHDVPLAIITLIAFSAIYTIVRLYFAHKKLWLLFIIVPIIIGLVVYILMRPQGITLSINGQAVTGSTVSFTEGSVSVNPAPGDDGKYAKGTTVTLTANAGSDYDWKGWTATSNDTSNPATISMDSRKQVTVTFEPRFTLSINNQLVVGSVISFNEGSVSVDKAPGDDDKYAKGTVVTLTANPASGYGLKNWAGSGTDVSNPTTVTINSNKHVTVTFELRFPLTINNQLVTGSSANFTEGSVSLNPAPGTDARYAKDTAVMLTASPASGYRFDRWEGDASGNATMVNFTMNSNKNVTAAFKKVYTLTISVNASGSGSVSPGSGTYDVGTTLTLTASPASGYRFDHWEGDISSNVTTVTITMNSNKNVTAIFKKVYTLTTSVNPSGSGSVSPGNGTYDDGTTVTLTASPASGYRFGQWEGDASGNVTLITISMNSTKSITATFVKISP